MITVIGNLKGGTGKSTVTFNLAVWLRLAEIDVKVIDLDPQQTLLDVAYLRQEEGIEPHLTVQAGPLPEETLLRAAEETLIDVGTADFESFKRALMIADRVLIPVTPSQADIWSTQRFLHFLRVITRGEPPESITFLNRADTNPVIQESAEAAAALRSLPGARFITERICERALFRTAFSKSLAVFEMAPLSSASSEFKALAEAVFGEQPSATRDPVRKQPAANPFQFESPFDSEPSLGEQAIPGKDEPTADQAIAVAGDEQGTESTDGGKKKKAKKNKKAKGSKKGDSDQQDLKYKKSKKDKKGKKHKKGKKNKKGRKG